MMFWLPRFLICSCASKLAPSPMASMAMTEQTPNTMPSTVSSERKAVQPEALERQPESPPEPHWRQAAGEFNASGLRNAPRGV